MGASVRPIRLTSTVDVVQWVRDSVHEDRRLLSYDGDNAVRNVVEHFCNHVSKQLKSMIRQRLSTAHCVVYSNDQATFNVSLGSEHLQDSYPNVRHGTDTTRISSAVIVENFDAASGQCTHPSRLAEELEQISAALVRFDNDKHAWQVLASLLTAARNASQSEGATIASVAFRFSGSDEVSDLECRPFCARDEADYLRRKSFDFGADWSFVDVRVNRADSLQSVK